MAKKTLGLGPWTLRACVCWPVPSLCTFIYELGHELVFRACMFVRAYDCGPPGRCSAVHTAVWLGFKGAALLYPVSVNLV